MSDLFLIWMVLGLGGLYGVTILWTWWKDGT